MATTTHNSSIIVDLKPLVMINNSIYVDTRQPDLTSPPPPCTGLTSSGECLPPSYENITNGSDGFENNVENPSVFFANRNTGRAFLVCAYYSTRQLSYMHFHKETMPRVQAISSHLFIWLGRLDMLLTIYTNVV